jgi:hypothetical protein
VYRIEKLEKKTAKDQQKDRRAIDK